MGLQLDLYTSFSGKFTCRTTAPHSSHNFSVSFSKYLVPRSDANAGLWLVIIMITQETMDLSVRAPYFLLLVYFMLGASAAQYSARKITAAAETFFW